eukprot:SAG22_NODE_1173_length_5253_cov_4.401436_6_plen_40_part_00
MEPASRGAQKDGQPVPLSYVVHLVRIEHRLAAAAAAEES